MKILVGYDGSKAAENALEVARTHATTFDAEIIIATSLEQGPNLQKEDIETDEEDEKDVSAEPACSTSECSE